MWERIKNFFKDSETIFWARMQLIGGIAVGALASMNWAPLIALGGTAGFTGKQVMFLGAILGVQGLVTEILRRVRDPEMK